MMSYKDFIAASEFWIKQDEKSNKMSPPAVKEKAFTFLQLHNTCALGTGYGNYVRVTPLEYTFLDGCFYMLSEGGKKFLGLSKNSNVSIAVFEPYSDFGNISSIQVSGIANVIDESEEEYLKILKLKKISVENIKKMGHPLYLIKIIPTVMELLFSEFKNQNVSVRQQLIL